MSVLRIAYAFEGPDDYRVFPVLIERIIQQFTPEVTLQFKLPQTIDVEIGAVWMTREVAKPSEFIEGLKDVFGENRRSNCRNQGCSNGARPETDAPFLLF